MTESTAAGVSAERLLRDLRTTPNGLSEREAERRLVASGPNELTRRGGARWPREVARQLTHPLALLLWAAAALAFVTATTVLAAAIVAVVLLNAGFAFLQERQAERALEALAAYLPQQATVVREGRRRVIDARTLVPGDVLLLSEGDRISADARLLEGDLEVDMSTLTGESFTVSRSARFVDEALPYLQARDLVFSGTTCTGGDARAVVLATGMQTELGRIAALSERVHVEESPLERQVRRVAWLIALVAVGVGLVFLAVGTLAAGLPLADAATFAVGLIVANVPEGLLPTITLALAVGVRALARRGALVKRLSAVETLGSATVIATDKTGTLTENRMSVVAAWGADETELKRVAAACTNAELAEDAGDPTELALLRWAGVQRPRRLGQFHFDAGLKLMSTIDESADGVELHVKGAPEVVLSRSTRIVGDDGERPLDDADREQIAAVTGAHAEQGLRVLGVARRGLTEVPERREDAERDLTFVGLVAMLDPPRPEVAEAVRRCHEAGIRVVVVTGDHPLTAAHVAREIGVSGPTIPDEEFEALTDAELDRLLRDNRELVFARTPPEGKLRIADALRHQGEVVAMTGDGVNDAPALRRADIGIAMGKTGTDVAREAATMVLTDDNFATIVAAIEEGRRTFANVRKFIFYIFVHAVPEVVPFLLFALSGGLVPLPLTVQQILAIDLGTETLPALALGREPAEDGIMRRPPRARTEGVVRRDMLVRAWLYLGSISAVLALLPFFLVLLHAGWSPGDAVGGGSPLHHAYRQATTMTFLAIVVCQVGTALAARTDTASLREIGFRSNPLLLWGIAFELAFAALIVFVPGIDGVIGLAAPPWWALALLLPYPLVVWGADELRRRARRR